MDGASSKNNDLSTSETFGFSPVFLNEVKVHHLMFPNGNCLRFIRGPNFAKMFSNVWGDLEAHARPMVSLTSMNYSLLSQYIPNGARRLPVEKRMGCSLQKHILSGDCKITCTHKQRVSHLNVSMQQECSHMSCFTSSAWHEKPLTHAKHQAVETKTSREAKTLVSNKSSSGYASKTHK
eukprot:2969462-Amphidinium_carterae.2